MQQLFTKSFSAFILLFLMSCNASASKPQIAIVIDDMGYRSTDRAALTLKGQFTYAILPFAPFTEKLAQMAYRDQKEVIAHLPMEALNNNHLLGKGALLSDMDEATARAQINKSLDNIPHIQGINNHMGSKLTTQEESLTWLMDELSQRNLYFLDSLTTSSSIAQQSAINQGLPAAKRHIFLDNKLDRTYLKRQFLQLIKIAHQNDYAIAIAHPHPQTIAFLHTIDDTLKQQNIELVPLSTLLPQTTAFAKRQYAQKKTTTSKRTTQSAPR